MSQTADAGTGSEIAIIGMAGRFPGAATLPEFWRNLRDGVESITRFDQELLLSAGVPAELLANPHYVAAAPVLPDVDLFDAHLFNYPAREAALIDPQQRLFLECSWQALEDAGYAPGGRVDDVGVYAGAALSTYLLHHLLAGRSEASIADTLELLVTNDKDYLASRVSYKLGLRGPSVAVQTACSSSLVSIHLACQGLLDGDCRIALAGGVAVRLPQPSGYLWQEGMIFSSDGHCRPYDASATGTLFGSGVGVVALKRLSDALADRDRVLAVVKGSAVTNDGANKVGYTAPGMAGQARAISTALGLAGVEPATVTAIEGHGTATPLGDPIEVAALTRAFRARTDRRQYCALSSVKSNVGHLDTAAGVAGLIKAVLQIQHGQLVPNLHFTTANPEIDFSETPFFVNTEVRDWAPGGDVPRRIGVSSFGMGGTNAHVVLEEPPTLQPRRQPPGGSHLITVSAQTAEALTAAAAALADALESPAAPELADAAYTLRVGRQAMAHRRAVIADSSGAAAMALRGKEPGSLAAGVAPMRPRVAFMFPGQGSQRPGMGAHLYESEPAFRDEVDACARFLTPLLGLDLRALLFPPAGAEPAAAEQLERTEFAQPALFTVEYALVRLLDSWGVKPEAMIGHSVGEIVAACVAGVFTRDDALALVAERGRLMQQLPHGSMLSVALPAEQLQKQLPPSVSIAAINAAELCVLSGETSAINALEAEMSQLYVPCKRLRTSHAFHSVMMEPMVDPFRKVVADLPKQQPSIPYLSNLTGRWSTPEEAIDPAYWSRHVRQPVRFAEALDRLTEQAGIVLIEVGPGRTLQALANQGNRRVPTVAAMDEAEESAGSLSLLSRLWANGVELDDAAFPVAPEACRVALPTYPFQRRSYWVAPAAPSGNNQSRSGIEAIEIAENADATSTAGAATARPPVSTEYTPPLDDRERLIAGVWQELLGVAPVGRRDNFIELGGHSLLAAKMVTRVKDAFGVPLTLRELIAAPTVADLADLVAQAQSGPTEATAAGGDLLSELPQAVPDPANISEPFPLTEIQQAQWIGRLGNFEGGNVAAHVYWEIDAEDIDLERLEDTWQAVIHRHEMLRAIVLPDGRQRVLSDVGRYRIQTLDLSSAETGEAATSLAAVREELTGHMRSVDEWPLFDVRATRLPDGRTRIHLGFDLLIADIGSIRLISRDWRKLYQGETLRPLQISYRDYVLALEKMRQTPLYDRARDYWRERIAVLPPRPDLPVLSSPDPGEQREPISFDLRLDAAAWRRVTERSGALGLTPSAVMLAAYALVVGRWSRSAQFSLNVTVINRLPFHEHVADLVGEFASFDLLPVDLEVDGDLVSLARRLQEQSWADLEHRYFSGVEVLREIAREKGGGGDAVAPIVFTSTIVQDSEPGDETWFGWVGDMVHELAQTPQVWLDFALLETADGVRLSWHAARQTFPEGMLDQMFDMFECLVRQLVDEAGWGVGVGGLVPVGLGELVSGVNATDGVVPEGLLVDGLVGWGLRDPGRVAVVSADGGVLTFGELVGWASGVARGLREVGVGRGDVVAVGVSKSVEQVVAVVGVLLAGGVYLPVDVDLPVARRGELLSAGGCGWVLCAGGDGDVVWPGGVGVLRVDEVCDREGPVEVSPAVSSDVAYVIFTSGSTGVPKGVAVSHRAALNTCVDVCSRFGVGADDVVLGLSSLSFDLSVWDVFGVLGVGGRLVLPRRGSSRDPGHWLELVSGHGVTVWNSVPALAEMMVAHVESGGGEGGLDSVRLALWSGDWIGLDLPGRWRSVVSGCRVVSLGGATEAGIWSVFYEVGEVGAGWESVPYGRPLAGQRIYVLNDRWEDCPVGVVGELFIGGVGLAEGYWGDVVRSAERFVVHPLSGERLYRTGDLGRWLADGNVEFLGREDSQVKVGGFRIELGEVEVVLGRCVGVSAVVVVAVGGRRGRRLVGFVVPTDTGRDPSHVLAEVTAHAGHELPSYMAPSALHVVDRLPLTVNGKVDRNELAKRAATDESRPAATETAGALSDSAAPIAERLVRVMGQVLSKSDVRPEDNLFAIGGDSITGIQIVNLLRSEGVDITPADLFAQPTVAALAEAVAARAGTGASDSARLPITGYQQALLSELSEQGSGPAHQLLLAVATPEQAAAAPAGLIARHPALRLRLGLAGPESSQQLIPVEEDEEPAPLVDLSGLPEEQRWSAMRHMLSDLSSELDPVAGPTVKATIFDLGAEGCWLAWVVSALVVDAASWEILYPELLAAVTGSGATVPTSAQVGDGDLRALLTSQSAACTPAPGSGSEQGFASPEQGAASAGPVLLPPGSTLWLDDSDPAATRERTVVSLDPATSREMLEAALQQHRLKPPELVAVAVAIALNRLGVTGPVVAEAERDLRAAGLAGGAATVGPLSWLGPLPLNSCETDVAALVAAVKDAYRDPEPSLPANCGLLLRHFGEFDGGVDPFIAREAGLPVMSSPLRPLTIDSYLVGGRLHLQVTYPAGHQESSSFVDALREALGHVTRKLHEDMSGAVSPSDFPRSGLSSDDLATFLAAVTGRTTSGPAS
ncbi:amino acid adenylation domain-containing protein [Natronosporangium hydrolyticum]|uniref:Phenyloxazoline synthase MbtB n=1 Tax=Natronosporangium hydrolyticum TaxID=2811111 RepID=A0A895YCQ4_9ACTN|nr:non-ribosomal peptide synthetase/type I polyketide synthase [Natronosporangium hydrolyticum]QSB13995.1 amino acid adenylation domain-containing protein [Natronosporangium hydrolyticum]